MSHRRILFVLLLLITARSQADDWPRFLGRQSDGRSSEIDLIDEMPSSGPMILWRTKLGTGMSNVSVSGPLAVTLYQDAESQFAVCLNSSTGEIIWKTAIAPAYENAMGNGPRATPTIGDTSIYCYSGQGILTALNRSEGRILWSVDVPAELGGKPAEYGMASSPLVVDDIVVVQAGAPTAAVAAFDRSTGQKRWTSGSGASGYSSAVFLKLSGKSQIVAFTAAGASGIDPKTGTIFWEYPYPTDYDCNTASPVQLNDSTVLISSGENHGSTALKIINDGEQQVPQVVWKSLGKDSSLRAEWQTPIRDNGLLFGLDNVGSAGPITNLVCVRAADGERLWAKTRFGKSNLTLADGKLFLSTMEGELVIVKATADAFQETARAEVLKSTRQAPVIADGRLYLRDDVEVVCIDVRKK